MKYLIAFLLILSFYGFWNWLNRDMENENFDLRAKALIKEVPIKLKAAAPRRKRKKEFSRKELFNIKKKDQIQLPEDLEQMSQKKGNGGLLIILSDAGVDLDDIAMAINEMHESTDLEAEEYFDELLYLLPNKSREILENLVDNKMLSTQHFKQFFDMFVNNANNPNWGNQGRYSGHEYDIDAQEEYIELEY